jgi:anti-sigma factor RsiW
MADAELPADQVQEVAAHLLDCTKCKAIYDRLRSENRILIGALGVRALPKEEIRRLEKRVLQQIHPPRRPALAARGAFLLQGIFLIGVVLISYAVTVLLRVDPAVFSDQVAKRLPSSSDARSLAVNVAIALLIGFIVAGSSRVSLAFGKTTKGGSLSCF